MKSYAFKLRAKFTNLFSRHKYMSDSGLLRIYFPNRSFHSLKYTKETCIQNIITTVIKGRISPQNVPFKSCYALRAVKETSAGLTKRWLPSHFTMDRVEQKLIDRPSWRFELRIRFFPKNLKSIMDVDKVTFNYLHDQLKNDYIHHVAQTTEQSAAIRLGCLDIRKLSIHLNPNVPGKRINVEYIEKELGLASFFPENLLAKTKIRTLRKLMKAQLKELEGLDEFKCILKFAEILRTVWKFDQERYNCLFGTINGVLIVDPNTGVSFTTQTESKTNTSELTNFEDIELLVISDEESRMLLIDSTTSTTPLRFLFDSTSIASSVGYLIDEYCAMFSKPLKRRFSESRRSNKMREINSSIPSNQLIFKKQGTENESQFMIPRNAVDIISFIGQGKYGDVYKGTFKETGEGKTVAIKVGKENDSTSTELLLSEAGMMQKFSHPNIIRVYGVCPVDPVMVIMELAEIGELRRYIRSNAKSLSPIRLINYCEQLAMALEFLETNNFVHRDIVARKILMTSPDSIKLADFGISRQFDNFVNQTSPKQTRKTKIPIRWMAPESIIYNQFTHSSDVWMFGVCVWEIMTCGLKPYSGIANNRVADHIEAGNRLPQPSGCPDDLYNLMQLCWLYSYQSRPKFAELKDAISKIKEEMLNEIRQNANSAFKQRPVNNISKTSIDQETNVDRENKNVLNDKSQPFTVIGIDYGLICDLHNKAKEIVGAVLSLNVAAANKSVRGQDIILQAKFVGMAVRDFVGMIDIFAKNIDDNDKKQRLVESQEQIAEEMTQMIADLRASSVDAVVISSVKIAKISKTMFDSIQDQFFCSTTV